MSIPSLGAVIVELLIKLWAQGTNLLITVLPIQADAQWQRHKIPSGLCQQVVGWRPESLLQALWRKR
jgi:hypothetical protein